MDLIRYSTMEASGMTLEANSFMSVADKLVKYLRDEKMAKQLLLKIIGNKSKKGRLFGQNKDDIIVGGWNNRWSPSELQVLRFALKFIELYHAPLRYEITASPTTSSNTNKIWRVYHTMVREEQLDIFYLKEFRSREPKAIKDKIILCSKTEKGQGILHEIKNILIHKLNMNVVDKKPASGV